MRSSRRIAARQACKNAMDLAEQTYNNIVLPAKQAFSDAMALAKKTYEDDVLLEQHGR